MHMIIQAVSLGILPRIPLKVNNWLDDNWFTERMLKYNQ